jgi:hypothetical protein
MGSLTNWSRIQDAIRKNRPRNQLISDLYVASPWLVIALLLPACYYCPTGIFVGRFNGNRKSRRTVTEPIECR